MREPQSEFKRKCLITRVENNRNKTVRVGYILIMEDDVGVKAPVTRLRRRLSVEQSDDAKSSSAPNTPTKKRGARRAAKPELDLIDENAPNNDTPKTLTKKAAMKELEVQEKPVTPSRRSTRIKSNSSIVLETVQAIDSPRAKRASRRNSQVGSDNEAVLTPARLTRQTRKDSANIYKDEPQQADKPPVSITETIVEEPETSSQRSQNNSKKSIEHSQSPTGLRKSPRLSLKRNTIENSVDLIEKQENNSQNQRNDKNTDSIESNEKSDKENIVSQDKIISDSGTPMIKLVDLSNSLLTDVEVNKLSISNVELLNKLSTEPKINKNLNKSSSTLIDTQTQYFKHKRHRTKSWTALSDPIQNDNKCYSDSESTSKSKLPSSHITDVEKETKDKQDDPNEKSVHDISIKDKVTDEVDSHNNEGKLLSPPTTDPVNSITTNMFDAKPTNNMQMLVYIEESDSNAEQLSVHKEVIEEDQCVPIIQTHFDSQATSQKIEKVYNIGDLCQSHEENAVANNNDSCEPMDVDETIPDNTISNKSLLKTIDMTENKVSLDKTNGVSYSEKDKRKKLLLTLSTSQALDKSGNENKSTLILSQLKDTSDENNQSPQIATKKSLSNTDQLLNLTQDKEIEKKILPLDYQTSTPLQQKNKNKHTIIANSSDILPNNTSKIDKSYLKNSYELPKSNSNNSEESESDEELSQKESSLLDAEAEEASANYESGDSRDGEERQYERDHEIIQKGETLTSEDELSNDSDYEKNSFVVSSDHEDDSLLDGSGDDLSTGDNELKMTAGSKKKYNERMKKEQKKASREMYASRHKLNDCNKNNKSDLSKIKKIRAILDSSESEDESIKRKQKKYNRMRLDSSQDSSMMKSLDDTSKNQENDNLSVNCNDANEIEITITEDKTNVETDPLSLYIKKEPKTPKKETKNISIQFIDPEHSEKKKYDNNNSQFNMTKGDDPLEESNSSESSDSSANLHIQNYDSILNDLNKSMNAKKTKKGDISLNIDKKPKQKSEPIVDQLNLTQIKLKKKKQKTQTTDTTRKTSIDDESKVSAKKKSINTRDNESFLKNSNMSFNDKSSKSVSLKGSGDEEKDSEASASIDLHLLFSEDSNNSEDVKIKHKNSEHSNEQKDFIPLKKSHGKTDILETSVLESNEKLHTESAKKKKKRTRRLNKSSNENENYDDDTDVHFFVDTIGILNSTAFDTSSKIEKKNIQKHVSLEQEDSDSEAPMEVSNSNVTDTLRRHVDNEDSLVALNKSKTKTPKSDKKKKKIESVISGQDAAKKQWDIEDIAEKINQSGTADKSIDKSVSNTPKSEKKKARRMSEIQIVDQKDNSDSEAPLEVENKNVTEAQEQPFDYEEVLDTSVAVRNKSLTKTPKSEKKKKRLLESQAMEEIDTANKSLNESVTKKPKSGEKKGKRLSESQTVEQEAEQVYAVESTINKNESAIEEQAIQNVIEEPEIKTGVEDKSINKSATKTPQSAEKGGKKKKNLSKSTPETQMLNEDTEENDLDLMKKQNTRSSVLLEDSSTDKILNKSSSSEKKKYTKVTESNNMDNITEGTEVVGSKKRKRKSSINQIEKELESEGPSTSKRETNVPIATTRQNKKLKISHNIDDLENLNQGALQNTKISKIIKQKNQDVDKQRHVVGNQVNDRKDTTDVMLNDKKGTKKRKEREGDEGIRTAKVPKLNTSDKLQVLRLPESVLNQLEDKPTKKTLQVAKPKAISTTNFSVEQNKVTKNKPSSYLEESIYLNEEEVLEPKKRKYVKCPKVLPFLPTVSTSNSGYTTNFKVNILPKEIKFVAKSSSVNNFKSDYLQNKKIKRLGTYELYKKNRTIKMSKF